MALPATDAFTRGDSSDLGTNWTVIFNSGFKISSNRAICNTGSPNWDGAEIWNADAFGNDQYSQATFVVGAGSGGGLCVRGSSLNFYGLYSDTTEKYIFKVVDNEFTTLASHTNQWSDGAAIRLEANGDSIRPMLTGATDTELGIQTDADIASGAAGVSGYGTNAGVDGWEGGNLAAAARHISITHT